MKIKDMLYNGFIKLNNENISEPMLKARLLLAYVLNAKKEYLIIHEEDEISENKVNEYKQYINRIITGEPIQYITNHQEFMKLDFYVDKNVLIPRADTETLVEEVISKCINNEKEEIKVLDMCTGSGIIGISIAKYIKNTSVTCIDISDEALEIAKKNATINEISNIKFIKSNMFEKLSNTSEQFDIIVSNPPYIKTGIISLLDKEVQKEPKTALDGGEDGLNFYKIISENAYKYLKNDGYLAIEIGYDQKEEVVSLLKNTKKYNEIYNKKDLCGNDRVVVARRV